MRSQSARNVLRVCAAEKKNLKKIQNVVSCQGTSDIGLAFWEPRKELLGTKGAPTREE